eukprot:394920-Amphidinium_carterae.1
MAKADRAVDIGEPFRSRQTAANMARRCCPRGQAADVAVVNGAIPLFEVLDAVYGDPKDVMIDEAADAVLYGIVQQSHQDIVTFITRLHVQLRRCY